MVNCPMAIVYKSPKVMGCGSFFKWSRWLIHGGDPTTEPNWDDSPSTGRLILQRCVASSC